MNLRSCSCHQQALGSIRCWSIGQQGATIGANDGVAILAAVALVAVAVVAVIVLL
jgi:hypothetical protein